MKSTRDRDRAVIISNQDQEHYPDVLPYLEDDTDLIELPPDNAPLSKLVLVSLSMFGISFCWGCQFARASATFQALGMAENALGITWLAGPVSGLFVAPAVGTASDRIGARKPFMLAGLIGIIVGFTGFSNVITLGKLLGDDPSVSRFNHALGFAIAFFWISDISINAIQAPLRTLLVDIAPPAQQPTANALLSLMQGLGNFLVYSIGGTSIGRYFPFLKGNLPSSFFWDVRTLYLLGVVCVLVSVGCTLIFVQEAEQLKYSQANEEQGEQSSFWKEFWVNLPSELSQICVVQVLVWFNWFSYLVYVVPFVAKQIFHGNPDALSGKAHDDFDHGVQWVNSGLAVNSLVTLLCALLIPKVVKWSSNDSKRVYLFCLLVQLVLMFFLTTSQTSLQCMLIIGGLGIAWAGSLILPYSIAGEACAYVSNKGLYMSLLNVSICVPQILVSVVSMAILRMFDNDFRYILGLSVFAQLGGCLLLAYFQGNSAVSSEATSPVGFHSVVSVG